MLRNKMDTKELKEKSKELVKKVWNDNFFILFMSKRFPIELSEDYIREWKSRLMTGNPFVYMDSETLRVYIETILELYSNRDDLQQLVTEKLNKI